MSHTKAATAQLKLYRLLLAAQTPWNSSLAVELWLLVINASDANENGWTAVWAIESETVRHAQVARRSLRSC